jgi:hypothetical protein
MVKFEGRSCYTAKRQGRQIDVPLKALTLGKSQEKVLPFTDREMRVELCNPNGREMP